jgi:mono/diheme cytochrome c family protein
MRRIGLLLLVLAMVTAAGILTPAAAQTAEEGQKVFADQRCSLCHIVEGKGNKRGPLDGVGDKWNAEELAQWIRTPAEMAAKVEATRKPPMKSFASLPDADVDALVAYLLTLKSAQ